MPYTEQINKTRMPQCVAIIMGGNGRQTKQRGEERTYGHRAGTETIQNIIEDTARLGIEYLTLHTFSTEDWNRPQDGITALMNLLLESIKEETLMKDDIRFNMIDDFEKLPVEVQENLALCIERTSKNSGMYMVLALNYSSCWEITEAIRQIATLIRAGEMSPERITDECVSSRLGTKSIPDPDLLARTGGEIRLSNYLLWQCAYSELYFCDTFWPDFDREELYRAIWEYQQRGRRFGKTGERIS